MSQLHQGFILKMKIKNEKAEKRAVKEKKKKMKVADIDFSHRAAPKSKFILYCNFKAFELREREEHERSCVE